MNFLNKKTSKNLSKTTSEIKSKKLNAIDEFEEKLISHPLALNPVIKELFSDQESCPILGILDPIVFNDINSEVISNCPSFHISLHERTQFYQQSNTTILFEDENLDLESQPSSKSNAELKLYHKEHLNVLLNKENSVKSHLESNELDRRYFNENLEVYKDDHSGNIRKTNQELYSKVEEFCDWANEVFDCPKSELDPRTLMKIFLVNYECGPAISVKLNLEEVNFDKNEPLEKSRTIFKQKKKSQSKPIDNRFNYGKWYLPKSLWIKSLNRDLNENLVARDLHDEEIRMKSNRLTHKMMKQNGVQLYVDYFQKIKHGRMPYAFTEV